MFFYDIQTIYFDSYKFITQVLNMITRKECLSTGLPTKDVNAKTTENSLNMTIHYSQL